MKIFVLTLFIYLSISAANCIYANSGNTTLTANYPATSGSYNKIIITQSGSMPCTTSNAGMLFMSGGSLEICGKTGTSASTPVAIASGETCFNIFCSYDTSTGASGCAAATSARCPTNYPPSTSVSDNFVTTGSFHVVSTLCCGPAATIAGQESTPAVLP